VVNIKIGSNYIQDIELVILDKDGTIIEFYHYWSLMAEIRAKLLCQALKLNKKYLNPIMFSMGIDTQRRCFRNDAPIALGPREVIIQSVINYLSELGFKYKKTYDLCVELFKKADVNSRSRMKELVKPIEGAIQLITELRSKNCKIAMATADKNERARLAMDLLGWTDKFDLIVGGDQVKWHKPSPEMAHKILQTLNVQAQHAIMVGDAVTDIEFGRNAGLKASIGVLTGYAKYGDFVFQTQYIAQDISHIKIA
jgi:phosphoglycolate phosphatase